MSAPRSPARRDGGSTARSVQPPDHFAIHGAGHVRQRPVGDDEREEAPGGHVVHRRTDDGEHAQPATTSPITRGWPRKRNNAPAPARRRRPRAGRGGRGEVRSHCPSPRSIPRRDPSRDSWAAARHRSNAGWSRFEGLVMMRGPRASRTLAAESGAGVAKLADARDSKSRSGHTECGFDPHLRHQSLERPPRADRARSGPAIHMSTPMMRGRNVERKVRQATRAHGRSRG